MLTQQELRIIPKTNTLPQLDLQKEMEKLRILQRQMKPEDCKHLDTDEITRILLEML